VAATIETLASTVQNAGVAVIVITLIV